MKKILRKLAVAISAMVDNTPTAHELAGMSDALLADSIAFWTARGRLDTPFAREYKRRIGVRG